MCREHQRPCTQSEGCVKTKVALTLSVPLHPDTASAKRDANGQPSAFDARHAQRFVVDIWHVNYATAMDMVGNLILAAVGGTYAHAALLVHRVEAAVGVNVVVLGVPDVEGVPAGHRVAHAVVVGEHGG